MPSRSMPIPAITLPLALAGALGWGALAPPLAQGTEPSSSAEQPSAGQEAHDHTQHGAQDDHGDHGTHDHAAHDHEGHQGHEAGASSGESDPHAHHQAMMKQTGYRRSEHVYALPDVSLVGMDGEATSLLAELDPGKPVMVNFIFTTCTTICPVMTGVFAQVQSKLGPAADDVRMISVSIDPEYDTPERLVEYAARFKAGPQWHFLTGDPQEIVAVQRAFDVYRGNKMNHEPTTLLRRSAGEPWIRLDGIASAAEVANEYHRLVGD